MGYYYCTGLGVKHVSSDSVGSESVWHDYELSYVLRTFRQSLRGCPLTKTSSVALRPNFIRCYHLPHPPPQGENEQDQQHSSGSQSQPTTESQGTFVPLSSWHAQNSLLCPGYPTLCFSSPTRLKESDFLLTSSELVTLGLAEDLVFGPSLIVLHAGSPRPP